MCTGSAEWRIITAWSKLGLERGLAQKVALAVWWRASLIVTAWRLESGCLGSIPALNSCVY